MSRGYKDDQRTAHHHLCIIFSLSPPPLSSLPLLTSTFVCAASRRHYRAAAREAGLFMVAGEAASVAWLKEELNRGEEPARVLGHCSEPLVLATLLLAFLQELPGKPNVGVSLDRRRPSFMC